MVGRDHAHPQIEFLLAHRHLDAAVLGSTPLGDVEPRENLDTREDGSKQPSGGAIALDQAAVDPIAHTDPVLERFDVNIGGPQLHCLGDDEMDQPDNRRAALVDLFFAAGHLVLGLGEVDGRVGEFLEHRVGAFAHRLAVIAVDGREDVLARGQRDFDPLGQQKPELFEEFQVVGVTDDNLQFAAAFGQR